MPAATVRPDMVEEVFQWLQNQRAVIRQGVLRQPTFRQVRLALQLARVSEIADALSRYRLEKIGRRRPQRVPTRSAGEIAQDRGTVQARQIKREQRKATRIEKAEAAVKRRREAAARVLDEIDWSENYDEEDHFSL